jgi:hypothetical protein
MPWWFWIITHVWIVSFTIIVTVAIHEDEYRNMENWKHLLAVIALHIFAPITVLFGAGAVLWENVIKYKVHEWAEGNYRLKRFFENRKRKKEEKEQVEKDFKEMEDNEDQWRIERLGIKLR